MNDVPDIRTRLASVPYGMFVDRNGLFGNFNVCEPISKRDGIYSKHRLGQAKEPLQRSARDKAILKKDAAFKMFMGNESNKDLVVLPFLRAFWGHLVDIPDLELKSVSLNPDTLDSRNSIPDVVWQNPYNGDVFLIEMQRRRQPFYFNRISLYDCKLRTALALKGAKWDHSQVSVFVIGLADFRLYRNDPFDFIHEYAGMNTKNNGELFTGQDYKILVDLKLAKKLDPVLFTERDKWLFLLNNFQKLKEIPTFLKGGSFEKVLEIAKNINRLKMEEVMDFIYDLHQEDRIKEATRKGIAKGKAEGKAEGLITAIKSFIENRPKGRRLTASETALLFGVDEALVRPLLNG